MDSNHSLEDVLEILSRQNYRFAAYKKPHEDQVIVLVDEGTSNSEAHPGDHELSREGFYMKSFHEDGEKVFIKGDHIIPFSHYQDRTDHALPSGNGQSTSFNVTVPPSVSKEKYLKSLGELVQRIRKGQFRKVVFSRVIEKDITDLRSTDIFLQALKSRKDAFVYLVRLSDRETWLGASPEVLLCADEENYHSMSLAGTRRISDSAQWTKKETEEQEMVSNTIEENFRSLGLDVHKEGPVTVSAGKHIEHLRTVYKAKRDRTLDVDLLNLLHPTPAVCGIPRYGAVEWLKHEEEHDRSYYAGFLGPVLNGGFDFFVNLRCALILDNKAYIYVGGGITADSDPESEWEETESKARTLLDLMEKSSIYS